MELKMFCVYDDKAKAYLPPFFLPEIGMAARVFGDCVNDAAHQFGKHPSDYTLFQCGSFDQNSGVVKSEGTLLCVAHGVEMVARVEESEKADWLSGEVDRRAGRTGVVSRQEKFA